MNTFNIIDFIISIAVLFVNTIVAIFAVAAAIIAVVVYKKTAKQQERAINLSLLDERLKLYKYLEHDIHTPSSIIKRAIDGKDWEYERFKLLFSEEIVSEYVALAELEGTIEQVEKKKREIYFGNTTAHSSDNDSLNEAFDKRGRINNAEIEATSSNATPEQIEAFRIVSIEETGSEEYFSLVFELEKKKKALSEAKDKFFKQLLSEIRDSISSNNTRIE